MESDVIISPSLISHYVREEPDRRDTLSADSMDAVKSYLAAGVSRARVLSPGGGGRSQSQPGLHYLPLPDLSNMLKPALGFLDLKGVAEHDNGKGFPFR